MIHLTFSHHFHIQWIGKEDLVWECFESHEEARKRAIELLKPGETFWIVEVSTECPLALSDGFPVSYVLLGNGKAR